MRYILFLLVFLPFFASAQPSEVAAKKIRATEKLQLDTATLTQIVRVISVASTHSQSPTAKAVYDFCQTLTGTTNLTFSGSSSPVTLNSSTGTDVTFTAGGGISLAATGTNTTITATDQSTTNEPLTISVGANSETLAGQTLIVTGSGIITPTYTPATNTLNIAGTEVDGSTTNELQTIAVTGTTTGTVTLSNSGGSVNIAGAGTNTVGVSGNTITVTGTGDSKWTAPSGSGIYNTALNNVSVGTTSVGLAKFRVVGNAAATGARFDAGALEDFGAATQITGLGVDIFGINASLTASDEATYLFANQSETSGADATAVVQAVGGNPTTIYSIVGEGTSFIMGCDNAQSGNPFKIKPGSNIAVFGGLTMDDNSNVGINEDIPTTELDVSGSKGISMPTGNNAARPTGKRTIRFNGDIGGFEALGANSVWYRISGTVAPSVSWNSGVIGTGGSASVTLATGSNSVAGTIVITTGTNPTGTNVSAVTLTYGASSNYNSGVLPFIQICQANAITATEWNKFHVGTSSTTLFQIGVAAQLAANTTYRINYRVTQ